MIETIIICKLPLLSREEIRVMLQVEDIRKTRVYQEAREEGREVGREEGREEGREAGLEEGIEQERRRSILRLAARKMTAEEIAECLEVDVDMVRETLAGTGNAETRQTQPTGRSRKS